MTWRLSSVLRRRSSREGVDALSPSRPVFGEATQSPGRRWSLDPAWRGDLDVDMCSVTNCGNRAIGVSYTVTVPLRGEAGTADLHMLCQTHTAERIERPPWSYEHGGQVLQINGFINWLPEPYIWMSRPSDNPEGAGTSAEDKPGSNPRPKRFRA
jgi:hypothetical protein